MKTIVAGLASLVLGVSLSGSALAQEQFVPPPPQAELVPAQPAITLAAGVYPYPAGQWVYDGYGRTWSVSPWAWGPRRYGAWGGHSWRAPVWRGGRAAYPHYFGRGGYGHYGHRR
jgi:hypothetical protein